MIEAFGFEVAEATERRCTICGEVRPIAMFYVEMERRRALRDGRKKFTMPCRYCQSLLNQKYRAERLAYSDKIKLEAGCADCGIKSDHPEIYDFDHLDATTKIDTVSTLLNKGTLEDFVAEIAKCEVVCSNCHRIRTRARKQLGGFGVSRPRKPKE
jgi:hypothetical protein